MDKQKIRLSSILPSLIIIYHFEIEDNFLSNKFLLRFV